MIIGLAGKVCAGKSSLAQVFAERGFLVIDADRLGHRVLETQRDYLKERFGEAATPEGLPVNRGLIARRVFADSALLTELEAVVHPGVADLVRKNIAQAGDQNILIEAAVLHRGKLVQFCQAVVWVEAPLYQRVCRQRSRDHRSWRQIFAREWTQRLFSVKAFLQDVDTYIVDNGHGFNVARQSLEALLDRIVG